MQEYYTIRGFNICSINYNIFAEEIMIELFILETCPYCRKVLDYCAEHNIEIEKRDVSDPENYNELLEFGRREQVPFMYDKKNNVKMYESDDIINYLKTL